MDPTQALNFEIGCASNAFAILKEFFIQLKGVAKVGELIDFHACMDIMDLLYEKEETSRLYMSPVALAASVLVCSYIITVPKQSWEFPILPWVKFATSCSEEYIQGLVKVILQHIFADILASGNER